jgi:hypothetical protein
MYRRTERYGHPAYEAGRVRRMGIAAPGGYANTVRDASYRRWQRRDGYYDDYDEDRGYSGRVVPIDEWDYADY